MPQVNKTGRISRAASHQRVTKATEQARAITFAQQVSHETAFRNAIIPGKGAMDEFNDLITLPPPPENLYDTQALAWRRIAIAAGPQVTSKITGNTGTVPELILVGRMLAHNFILNSTLLFQQSHLYGFRKLHRTFTSDVAIIWAGKTILLPVDGIYFHERTLAEIQDAANRNRALSKLGRVVPILDIQTYSSALLDLTLHMAGVP